MLVLFKLYQKRLIWSTRAALILLIAFCYGASAQQSINVNAPVDDNGYYSIAMLKLALSKINSHYVINEIHQDVPQARNIEQVAAGELDIMWAATNQEMEDTLEPIRIPLYKGLLGHRIFIIHPSEQSKFDQVKTFDDLKRFSFGQGSTWADTKILESNGLKVTKASKYESLFYMTDGQRFDAFPRGVQEPWGEIEKRANLELTVEKRIMLIYPLPFYLFTNKHKADFARELESGFEKAIADGSFDKIFFSSSMVKNVLDKANLKNRLTLPLNNPTLPKETPIERKELWLDITNL